MNSIIRRFLPNTPTRSAVRLEQRANAKEGDLKDITGLAAVYYNAADPAGTQYQLWDNWFERIQPGAFDRAVKEDDVRALQNHDPRMLLGRSVAGTLQLELTSEGLAYRITPPDTQVGRDTLQSIQRGDMDGSSFAFRPSAGGIEWTEERVTVGGAEIVLNIRNIKAVELFDVGPVTYPAYTATSAGTRSPMMFLDSRSAVDETAAIRAEFDAFQRATVWTPAAERRKREMFLAEIG